jgi:hypothetical protein
MSQSNEIATLEFMVVVLGDEVARLTDENDELRARLALATGHGEALAEANAN